MAEPRYPYLHVDVARDDVEEVSYLLWELGAQGVEERDATTLFRNASAEVTLVASFADEGAVSQAASELAERAPRIEYVEGDAWRDEYKKYFKVTRLGERLVIRPSWEQHEAAPRDVVVTVDPGRAFGTGTHESTRLLMRELDGIVRGGERVLDVGCGTGILAICALKLGAHSAVCIDVDEDAVAVTRENAALNEVAERIAASTQPVGEIRAGFDLVLANIQADVLIPLAAAIGERVEPRGSLLLSGILKGQEGDVAAAYGSAFDVLRAPEEGEWIALILQKR